MLTVGLAVPIVISLAVFVAIPAAIVVLVAASIIAYRNRPKPSPSTAELRAAAEVTSVPSEDDFTEAAMMRFVEASDLAPIQSLIGRYVQATRALYRAEDLANPLPPLPPGGDVEEGRYRDRMLARTRKLNNVQQVLPLLSTTIGTLFVDLTRNLPSLAIETRPEWEEDPTAVTVPLLDVVPNIGELTRIVMAPFFDAEIAKADIFYDVRKQLEANIAAASEGKKDTVFPQHSKLPPRELVDAYLKRTPFSLLFDVRVPLTVSLSKQLEHQMVVGGTRWGKSQLMGTIIRQHLSENDPPGLIVIDSQGDFLSKISQLEEFHPETGRLKDRLLILNPEDRAAPALNMFDISALRAKGYTPADLEAVEAEVIHLFSYVFSSMATEMTSQQSGTFSYLVRLLLMMPGSNIHTLKDLLEDRAESYAQANPKYRQYIDQLDATAQSYFRNQYYTRSSVVTRQAIARRLYGVIQVRSFERMFGGANKVDFAEAMNQGKVIVVNTSKAMLKPEASALFGRYVIARVLSGAFERVTIPMEKRRPCLMFVDEAQEYFDDSLDTLLTQIAKFKLGICIAFQYVDQLPNKLRSSVIGNTTVKYVGGVTFADARYLAREMRVNEMMVLEQKKDPHEPPQWAQFATFVRNYTAQAVSLTVPFYALEKSPRMDGAAYGRLLERNRLEVSQPDPRTPDAPRNLPPDIDEPPDEPPPVTDPPEPPSSPPAPENPPPPPQKANARARKKPPTPSTAGDELPTEWGGDTIKKS